MNSIPLNILEIVSKCANPNSEVIIIVKKEFFEVPELITALKDKKFFVTEIYTPISPTQSELLLGFQAACSFPGYFGSNWDALDECLRDFSWEPPVNGYILIYRGYECMYKKDWLALLDTIEYVSDVWAKEEIIFKFLIGID